MVRPHVSKVASHEPMDKFLMRCVHQRACTNENASQILLRAWGTHLECPCASCSPASNNPSSAITIGHALLTPSQVMSDPSQQTSTAVLQQATLDLAAQVSALVAAEAGAPSGPAVRSAPSGHVQPNSIWTRHVDEYDGNGYEASRELVRNANGVRVYGSPSVDSHTVAVMLSNKLTGAASVWYE